MSVMKPMQTGDEIRIIAPSFSRSSRKDQRRAERAKERLEGLGYRVSFGKFLDSQFHLGTAKAKDRAQDLNDAYADKTIKAIMAYSGGWSANEVLPFVDWQIIQANPKPLVGFSDITVLLNAIYAKTGTVGYLGPNFGTLGRMTSWEYTLDNLNKVLKQEFPLRLTRSKQWGSEPSDRFNTKPWRVLQKGQAEGKLIGGNLGTFYLLQGTEYQPKFDEPFILIAEDDDESGKLTAREFSRRLESILQLPNIRTNMKGLLIGRFQPNSKVSRNDLASIVAAKQLSNIPVIADIDFGHTVPMLTLPVGGRVRLNVNQGADVRLLG